MLTSDTAEGEPNLGVIRHIVLRLVTCIKRIVFIKMLAFFFLVFTFNKVVVLKSIRSIITSRLFECDKTVMLVFSV